MKKKFIFITLFFLFFVGTRNVLASGVSQEIIEKNKTNNVYELSVGDYLCVYKTQDNKNYIAIKFKKQSSNRYDLMLYHNDGYSYNEFDGKPNTLIYDTNGNLYLKETPNCSDYIYMDNVTDKYYSILSLNNIGNEIEKNDYIFDDSLSILNVQEEDPIVTETPATDLFVDIQNTRFYYKEDESGGHFESQTGVWACYVKINEDASNPFSYIRQAIPLDMNFNDPNLVVQIDTTGVCKNGYMILKKDSVNQGNGSTLESENNIQMIDKYVSYNSGKEYAFIYEKDGNLIVQLNGNKRINVKNLNDYKSIFRKKEKDSYPKYLIYTNGSYYFSDKRKVDTSLNYTANIKYHSLVSNRIKYADGNKVYMSLIKMNTISLNGKNATIETCSDLFGTSFLTFLKENVFKIIYIAIPILLIVLTTFDFAKVVFIDDKEGIKKAGKRFGQRAIVAVVIYLVPTILLFVSNLLGADEVEKCVKYFNQVNELYSDS